MHRPIHLTGTGIAVLIVLQFLLLQPALGSPPDADGDGIPDEVDNCPAVFNPDQLDTDADGQGDVCDVDDDNDGVHDAADTNPLNRFICRDVDADTCDDCMSGSDDPSNDGTDTDGDGLCDLGDPCPTDPTNSCQCPDTDGDGVCDEDDVAPLDPFVCRDVDADTCDDCSSGTDNPANDGSDFDGDGLCDAGDPDDDDDGIPDGSDPCPLDPTNSCQCSDADADGICDDDDNCPFDFNPVQTDTDGDGLGDVCDADDDNDGIADVIDPAPRDPMVCGDTDADACDDCSVGVDGFGPLADNDPSNDGPDFDGDGQCNVGDPDDDNDGIPDASDPCPLDPTNSCVCPDADSDGICDAEDNCPFVHNPAQEDQDADGLGDVCDPCPTDPYNECIPCTDTDADTICDEDDNCPFVANTDQSDVDADGFGDVCDPCPTDPWNACVWCVRLPYLAGAWWPGDGHDQDLVGGHDPVGVIGTPGFVEAHVLEGFRFAGQDGYVIADDLPLDVKDHESASIVAWLRVDDVWPFSTHAILDKREGSEGSWTGYLLSVLAGEPGQPVVARFELSDGVTVLEVETRPFQLGPYHQLAVVLDRVAGTIAIYLDGRLQSMRAENLGDTGSRADLFVGYPSSNISSQALGFAGVLDELQLFTRELTWCEVRALHRAGTEGVCRDDGDSDGVLHYADNCPVTANPNQEDQDFDRAGDSCDCRPTLLETFRAPGEADGLMFGAGLVRQRLGWCHEGYESGYGTVFTVARGLLSELPVGSGASETCLVSAFAPAQLDDEAIPPENGGFWYLLRANNLCGVGHYGFDSEGHLRGGPTIDSCPTSEEALCWMTGGSWDLGSCGHYVCDQRPDCDAIVPGCDCGPHRNFVAGVGCVFDPACP